VTDEETKTTTGDVASHETQVVYVPVSGLARVDSINVFSPFGNRVMARDRVLVPTTVHTPDSTLPMDVFAGVPRQGTVSPVPVSTSVLKRLHGSDSDDLFAAALKSKQESLIHTGTPRFTLVGKLGEGSQGIVYRVNDRDCHREVACKVLSYATSDPEEISRFIHEAQVTSQLEHPGVVPVHDLGELRDGTVYYTMKRVDGVSLLDLLQTRGGKAEYRFELLEMFLRICETVAFAHSRGVVHRDLKPRNIMAGPFGEVLVLDWGLAKVVNCPDVARPMASMRSFPEADPYRTLNGTAVGTPAYMSPEQAMGEVDSLDRRCDIYSLGVILYEILAGVSPYVRGEARKVMHQVSHGMWTRLDQRPEPSRLPRALIAIVHRAMAFERVERYQTVETLADDLRSFLAGQAVSAYQESTLERFGRVLSHHRRQVRTGLAVAGVAALMGLGVWGNQWREMERMVGGLHEQLEERLASRDYPQARAVGDRILALRPEDRRTLRQLPRIEEGLRSLEMARLLAAKRSEADELIREASGAVAEGGEAQLTRAGELYMRALGLVGDDPAITGAYQEVIGRLASLEQQRQQAEHEKRRRVAAVRQLESAQRAQEWAKPKKIELMLRQQEHRALAAATRGGDDETMRSRLHAIEESIENLRRELADLEGRAASFFDNAVALAPDDAGVRRAVADYYLQRLMDYEARGDLAGALVAENRCRMFDDGRNNDMLRGLSWLTSQAGQPPVTLQSLVEGRDRTLEAEAPMIALADGIETALPQGRYLARNALGVATALRLRRGDHRALHLPAPPPLPESVVFITAGTVIDADGNVQEEVGDFAIARREVTCGEWLAFLNDPAIRAVIDGAEQTGALIFVPRQKGRALWPREADGTFRLPTGMDGVAVVPAWPVCHISGRDALAYARWLARREQLPWRLPSHPEWLLAAQGGDGRTYPWGLRADLGFSATGLTAVSGEWCSSPVGSHPRDRSVQGVHDLGGSVAELVLDGGIARLAAGGSYHDRQPEAFAVHSHREVVDTEPEASAGVRLALSLPTAQR
jgi:hypothetical protein